MFGRRVFASSPIPPHMYGILNISSAKQANRRLPSLVPVNSMMARSMGTSSLLQLISGAGCGLAAAEGLAVGGGSDAIMEQLNLVLSSGLMAALSTTVNPCLWSDYSKVRTMLKCERSMASQQ